MAALLRCAGLLAVAACGDNAKPRDPLAVATLVDINPDPAIVEVRIVASPGAMEYLPGKRADIWGYRDGSVDDSRPSVPGPLLEAHQGDHVIVHFTNELPEPTTIHWHGVRVPNAADGSDHTQMPVAPGDTFDYAFDVPDAALFWYHPHVDGAVQVEKGLYAPLIVRGGDDVPVDAERVLVIDDVKLAADGNLDPTADDTDMMYG